MVPLRFDTRRNGYCHTKPDYRLPYFRIAEFPPVLDTLIGEGLITLERVRVILYRHARQEATR